MPGFTFARPNLHVDGPLVDLTIRAPQLMVQALVAAGQPAPQALVQAVAMIDTGATSSVITPAVAQALGLQPVNVVPARGAVGHAAVPANVYNVDIVFPGNNVIVPNAAVLELPLAGQNIQALIGRDILRHGTLIYMGYANLYSLSF